MAIRPWKMWWLAVALVTGTLTVGAIPVEAASEGAQSTQKALSGGLVFVVHGITDPYSPPSPGTRLVAVDVEVRNPTRDARSWAPEELADLVTKGARRGTTADVVEIEPAVDDPIEAGSSWRGLVVFEVPADARVRAVRLRGDAEARPATVKVSAAKPSSAPSSAAPKGFEGLEPTSEWGYFTLSGEICRLGTPFELTGSAAASSVVLQMEPTGDTTGTIALSGSVEGIPVIGSGQYTLEIDPGGASGRLTVDTAGTGAGVPAFVAVETIELGPTSSC